jgi:hypothetical protein
MIRAKIISIACFTVLIGVYTSMNARAQDFTGMERSILTFSAPVELPRMTLAAGTYVFQRPDPNTPHIVEVFTGDHRHIVGMFMTLPTQRFTVTGQNVITFRETREGQTPAVHYWYYPGLESGHEFVYPKKQALEISARTGEAVLTANGRVKAPPSVASTEPAAAPTATGPFEPANQAAAPAIAENQATTNIQSAERLAQREEVATSGQSAETTPTKGTRLPETASPLPLIGLVGLIALAGAGLLRRVRG